MKKIILIIAIANILFYNMQPTDFTLKDYFSGEYYCYTTADVKGLNLGFCSASTLNTTNKIGESIKIKNLEIDSALNTLNAVVVNTEYLNDGTVIIYAYTKLINQKVELNNTNVNIQLATNGTDTTIGWPLILGSF